MNRWLLSICLSLLVFDANTGNCQETSAAKMPQVLKAGAAISNITPPLGELIVGGWQPFPAKHIHDELFARCLVLDDGNTRLAFVICDNVGIPREVFDLAGSQIEEATGLLKTHVLMASTHTHSATTARGPSKVIWQDELTDYQKFIASRISDGVQIAINNLEPAKIAWGTVDEPSEVFNRRWFVTDPNLLTNPFGETDKVRMNPPAGSASLLRPAGPTDPQVSFVSVQSTSGRPIALLANYSLHYVGGVPVGDVSADYFGYFAKKIEQKLDAGDQEKPFVGILSNGTSGDVNNINFQTKSVRREPYSKMQEVAEKVAAKVYEAHQQLNFTEHVTLAAETFELPLNVRQPTPEMLEHLAAATASQPVDAKRQSKEQIYAERLAKLKDAPESITVLLQAFRIGELGIAAIPFETFTEIGLELKQRSPLKQTFTIELANGSFGYLPTPEQHLLGGYETWLGTNFVEHKASRRITETLLQLFAKLQP
ncbi:MAG: neutral/alkaline non-lysosomal ceramidase N-terminal domain-containing protein [Fuerstiella sp.]